MKLMFILALLADLWAGWWLFKYGPRYFGKSNDHPQESPGERSFNLWQVLTVWVISLVLLIWMIGKVPF